MAAASEENLSGLTEHGSIDGQRDALKEEAAKYRLIFGITTGVTVSIIAWLVETRSFANVLTYVALALIGFLTAGAAHILYELNYIVRKLKGTE